MSPQQERLHLSSLWFALSHDIVCQPEGGTPSKCTRWSSWDTALTARSAAKESTGVSVMVGSPSVGSSPHQPNSRWSGS